MKTQKLVRYLAWFFLTIGVGGWVMGLYIGVFPPIGHFDNIEFPLCDLEAFAIDRDGSVYTALTGLSRIQVYDKNGRFVRGWFIESGGKNFALKFDSGGLLHAAAIKDGNYYIFKTDGTLIKHIKYTEKYRLWEKEQNLNLYISAFGSGYQIGSSVLFPSIVRITPNGTRTKLIHSSFFGWFITYPLPVWIWAVVGVLLWGADRKWPDSPVGKTDIADAGQI